MTDYTELTDELYYAQELIAEAAQICRHVAEKTDDQCLLRTLVAGLEIVVETGGWLSVNTTIPQWIAAIEKAEA